MTLEEIRRSNNSEDESNNDQFPVGMRVLAVDDDKTCLKVLESFLRRCKYHVTTATDAVTALKMLRENKNKFDLVISDVQMPDMDGFKLLELIGLEMDLPVIMLSGNGDPRLVMKGVTHGACDYLLKPVRLEELRNIWQHVIRRKKSDRKDRNNLDNQEKSYDGGPDDGQNPAVSSPERNAKQVRKRKEQDEEEEGSGDEDGNENEDSTSQKKPRVVWSVELHRKFVAAVNQLGIDKAVPKKILDLMNVERLTRENVASHLQKYRLYLKRLSCVASQQANIVAAFGGKDPSSYMRLGSMDGLGDFQGFPGSGQLPNSMPQGGMLGRLNTATSLGMRSLNSAGMIHMGHGQSSSSSVNDYGKLQQVVHPGNQRGNLVQGMPNTLELDQLQHNQNISHIGEFSPGDSTVFPVSSGFTNNGMAIGNLNNSYLNGPNNSLMLQGPQQQRQNRGTFVNQPPARMPSLNSEPFEIGGGASSQLPDLGRCNDNWQSGVPLNGFSSTPMTSADPFNHSGLSSNNLRDNMTMVSPHAGNNLINVPAQNMASANMLDSRNITGQPGPANLQHSNPNMLNSRNVTSQPGPVNLQQGNPNFSTFGSMSNGVQQNMNFAPKQEWVGQNQDGFGSLNPVIPIQGVVTPLEQTMSRTTSLGNGKFDRTLGQNMGQSTGGNGKFDMTLNAQPNGAAPYLGQQNGGDKGTMPSTMKLNVEHFFDLTKSQDGTNSSCGSLEDLMSAMYRRERDDLGGIMDGDLNLDVFPVGTCM